MVPTPDGSDDFVGVGGPGERARIVVGFAQEPVDGGLQIDDQAEDAALQSPFGELGEEALDGIEPGCRGRGVVEDEARMALEPGADLGMLVRGVVVEDDVDVLLPWLGMPVTTVRSPRRSFQWSLRCGKPLSSAGRSGKGGSSDIL